MQKFANNAVGTLASAISNVETSITVSGSEGDRFPSLSDGDYFYATLVDEDGNREIVKVTARVGNTMTVERAQQGTSARAFSAGSKLSHRLTAAELNDFASGLKNLDDLVSKIQADTSGSLTTTGTETAYTLTTNQSFSSLANGITVTAKVHVSNGDNPTLAVDGLLAKPIRAFAGKDITRGMLVPGVAYSFTYDSSDDSWLVRGGTPVAGKFIGEIFAFAGDIAPAGCLFCYGQAVSRTTYAALFSVIQTTYGGGDGSTTFNLPDLRGRVVAGKDNMGGTSANRLTNQTGGVKGDTLGAAGGSETHTLTVQQLPSHTHSFSGTTSSNGAHSHDFTYNLLGTGSGSSFIRAGYIGATGGNTNASTQQAGNHTHSFSGTTNNSGGGQPHNNVQPTIVLNYCIFAGA